MAVFSFPEQVNERAARLVAAAVALTLSAALLGRLWWVVPAVALGFLLRVGWGPKVSPLGRAAVRLAGRLWDPRPVYGAPKRFAQGIGALCTVGASLCFAAGLDTPAWALVAVVVLFATLEAALGFCAGCWIYGRLQEVGLIAPDACVDCARPAGRLAP